MTGVLIIQSAALADNSPPVSHVVVPLYRPSVDSIRCKLPHPGRLATAQRSVPAVFARSAERQSGHFACQQ